MVPVNQDASMAEALYLLPKDPNSLLFGGADPRKVTKQMRL
jgi:hypothetical protein